MYDADEQEQQLLEELGQRFLTALQLKDGAKLDLAEDELRAILRTEPRLAEPRMELARILLDTDRLDEALEQAREALEVLEKNGPWTQDLEENVVQAIAHATLAEILRRKADEDDIIFGDPEIFRSMVAEAKAHFEKAAALDPNEDMSSYYAFFLGIPGAELDLGAPSDKGPVGDA
jgi:tetratricopeptide (TPR) repeat protein